MNNHDIDFITLTYGSKLYGTSTPTSDTDMKVVYLPSIDSLLLGQVKRPFKKRFDAAGAEITNHNAKMPDNGIETEFFTVQTFVRDFVQGQTYALEIAHGVVSREFQGAPTGEAYFFCKELIEKFSNRDVYSMTAFAQKQTLDYVHRAERMMETSNVLLKFQTALSAYPDPKARLDSPVIGTETLLDILSKHTGLAIGEVENNGKKFRSLELNGRSYMETTELAHIITLLEKQMQAYGVRTAETFGKAVEWKSMSHAIRVYEQAIELLDTGAIVFPRPDAHYLLAVKQGLVDFEEVKRYLKQLDADVLRKQNESTVREKTPELVAESEQWLLSKLHELYNFSV